jgi:hypothetical protein
VYDSLIQFGAPLTNISETTFTQEGIILQIGIAPRRIDFITHIDGVEFDDAYESLKIIDIGGLEIPIISKENLIKNKRATGREKDRLDADTLERN